MEKKEVLECIEGSDDGVYLDLSVSPDSSSSEITGVNPWRNQLEVSIKERAHRGEANRALVELFAEILNISNKRIKIVQGKTTKGKRIYFNGIDKTKLIDGINRKFEGDR
ncbi:MAG: DUF167 domain-containing protein [Candidatus Thermoplasmatota archaeon]